MSKLSSVSQVIILAGVLSLFSLSVQASDRFSWSSNVWMQPSWSSNWGGGIGSPYWNRYNYRPYWSNHWNRAYWNYPYRYNRPIYRDERQVEKPKVIAAPLRITTSIQYASGLNSLPENARVIQKDGRTIYEWQGAEYIFDWGTETYRKLK
ncbi:hypothetical protein HWQ46_21135 [Shewanella sp. D64]|uniref:hypothetical protein n=1 Tax=unclassified Shewanella TaxID=196818 RepID=UPI0022BA5172|nr:MULTISPECIES: hypothetical protein [unclassified Shewanella]MEC4728044.1 hypothetical protein [Shewanella sp. D64]MEC4740111.1 hypothetical protein [Shewanella sp. E94]WBJ95173.1 hypothetical protein HWQ47_25785 [Shewanella sp. MTB7]